MPTRSRSPATAAMNAWCMSAPAPCASTRQAFARSGVCMSADTWVCSLTDIFTGIGGEGATWLVCTGCRPRCAGAALGELSERRQVASVDIQYLSRDVGGRLRTEKYRGPAEIVEPTEAALWNLLEHGAPPLLVLVEGFREGSAKVTWTDAVHADIVGRPFRCQGARESGEPGLRCAVGRRAGYTDFGCERAYVDDAAAVHHAAGRRLSAKERPL